jgi:uncharacterized membrane protein
MDILFEITKYILCAIFLLSIVGSILLLIAVNKMNSYKKLFSIEHQDLI